MAFGSRGFKDFGLSSNLTLPMAPDSIVAQPSMPDEGRGKAKKHARFAPDQEEIPAEDAVKHKLTWAQRFKKLFKTKKKDPYSMTTPTPPHLNEDENEDERMVRVVRSGSDTELYKGEGRQQDEDGAQGKENDDGKPRKRRSKRNTDRNNKSQSTAFEHITPAPEGSPSAVHVVLKSGTGGGRKVVLHHKQGSEEGLGLHLSGGLPPITVTYITPGGQAELAGIKVGEVILEVNGLNCRRKVDISRLMELKMLIQQTRLEGERTKQEHIIDEASWDRIKVRQDELESETSTLKITSLDSASDEEVRSTAKTTPKKKKGSKKKLSASKTSGAGDPGDPAATSLSKNGKKERLSSSGGDLVTASSPEKNGSKKRHSSSKMSSGDLGDPVAASSPIREKSPKKNGKSKKRESSHNASMEGSKDNVSADSQKRESVAEDDGKTKPKKKKKKSATSSSTAEGSKISPEAKKKKKKKPKSADHSLTEGPGENSPEQKSGSEVPSKARTRKIGRDSSQLHGVPSVEEVDTPDPREMERNERSRRSNSPKSRYQLGEGEGQEDTDQTAEEKVTIAVIKKKKKSKKEKEKSSELDGKKKKSKSKAQASEKDKEANEPREKRRKLKKKKSTGELTAMEEPASVEEPSGADPVENLSASSAAISGSIESNTLTYVAAKKGGSKSSLNDLSKGSLEVDDITGKSSTLPRPRREKSDKNKSLSSSRESSQSTSYSNLKQETEKQFREELREASLSQRDIANSSATREIDPNIKVKKSGLIKEGKTPRPSIFDQSSSPEPEEVTPVSSGPVEDNILDSEFKMKKSGVVVGRRKSSSSSRPSILDEQQPKTPAFADIQPGEMKYNKKVSEGIDVDISAIPEISPTLGVIAGRDRLSASNRSLTKRRPPSLRQNALLDSKEEGVRRVELSNGRAASGGRVLPGMEASGTSRMATARKLFESKQPEKIEAGKASNPRSFGQSPVKAVGMSQGVTKEDKMASESAVSVRPRSFTTAPEAKSGVRENGGTPSWIAIAQDRQKRSAVEDKKPATANAAVSLRADAAGGSKDSTVPEMGHVAKRLAMFQKH